MNQKSSFNPFIFFGLGICIAAIPLLILHFFSQVGSKLQEAEKYYSKGENGGTIAERTEAFNRALEIYLQLENEYHPVNGNGKLYYNIGNAYYQLEQYPMAAFYYYQAFALMPRNEKVVQNLTRTLKILHIPLSAQTESPFSKLLFFHRLFSLPERCQLFSAAVILAVLIASAYIWLEWRQLKLIIGAALIISIVFFLSICYSLFLAPTEAVIIKASNVYRDAGDQYAKVQEDPISPGTKVEVLSIQKNGAWIKILTPAGTLGYLPQQNGRLLQN